MADQPFTSYAGDAVKDLQTAKETGGVLTDWFFNMFAGAIEIQLSSPVLSAIYGGIVVALVVLRLYFGNPIKALACAVLYIYTTIQVFSMYRTSGFVVDYTPDGWLVTAKSIWFSVLFTGIWVWGVSRALQSLVVVLATTGLGRLLSPLNPFRLLNKFRKSDAELDSMEEGSAKDPKRQLTAIMFTDIVGYSKQMGANEAAMVKKLGIHNEIMRNQIVRNRGTVIKTIGDAFMVRFRSAENAVQCAMDCQKGIGEYNKGKPADDQFHIRIGLHIGEVIHTGTDVFGEGVNIAARIEPKADPDGIAVSDAIVNAVRNKVPAHFASMGRLPMKNIANPPELFKVFPLEESASQKVVKAPVPGAAAGKPAAPVAGKSGKAAAAAPVAGGAPGGVFKI